MDTVDWGDRWPPSAGCSHPFDHGLASAWEIQSERRRQVSFHLEYPDSYPSTCIGSHYSGNHLRSIIICCELCNCSSSHKPGKSCCYSRSPVVSNESFCPSGSWNSNSVDRSVEECSFSERTVKGDL